MFNITHTGYPKYIVYDLLYLYIVNAKIKQYKIQKDLLILD